MTLLELLEKQTPEKSAITDQEPFSYAELIQQAKSYRSQFSDIKGCSVAIIYGDIKEFIVALCAFDGFCKNLYLLPDRHTFPNMVVNDTSIVLWPEHEIIQAEEAVKAPCLNTRWFIATSGTTSVPKWIEHQFESLIGSVKTSNKMGKLVWGLLYQPFRFAGLQVLLQSLVSGASIVDLTSEEVKEKLLKMHKFGVSAVSATPGMWRQLLMGEKLSELVLSHITLGGEIAEQSLLDILKRTFSQAQVRHIYASTEAGVGFVVSDGKAGFPADWLAESKDNLLSMFIDDSQHLWIRSNAVSRAIVNELADKNGFIDTQDLVEVKGDRVLFLGRATGVINVGGNKVHPELIEQTLYDIEGVRGAHVYAKKNSVLGNLVHADVVVCERDDLLAFKKEIIEYCKSKLQRYEIPATIKFVDNLTMTQAGKLRRESMNA